MPEERDLLQSAVNLINGALDHPEFGAEIKHGEVSAGALARMARDVASVVSVLQAQEHLELSRAHQHVTAEQLRYQRMAVGPLQEMAELIQEIGDVNIEAPDALAYGHVVGWVERAATLSVRLEDGAAAT